MLQKCEMARMAGSEIEIRWMLRRDMPQVMAIENAAFEDPWFEDDFTRSLRDRATMGLVAAACDRVVGFVVYRLHATRIQLLNLAVDRDFLLRGIGQQMIAHLRKKLSRQRRTKIEAYVRDSNLPAHLFFRACGFRATSVIPGYWDLVDGSTEDAYRFVLRAEGVRGWQ